MSLTFKQFSAYLEIPLEEEEARLDEIFGMFKSKEQKEKAERQKLELLAKRGNEVAKMKLRKLQADDEKAAAAAGAQKSAKDRSWQAKQAEVEAGERGSSRAYDRETGSAHTTMKPRWNGAKGEWEKYDPIKRQWVGTGDKDRFTDEPAKRGTR
jgi:hypothetical protein